MRYQMRVAALVLALAPVFALAPAHARIINGSTAIAWGEDDKGQTGATLTDGLIASPSVVRGTSGLDITQVSAAYTHAFALTRDGRVYGWGTNDSGELGIGITTTAPISTATLITGLPRVVQVAAGDFMGIARTAGGEVYVWGDNGWNELGTGDSKPRLRPYHLPGLHHIVTVAAGDQVAFAVDAAGRVYGWGTNTWGGLGFPSGYDDTRGLRPMRIPGVSDVIAIASSEATLALRRDGRVYEWGFGTPTISKTDVHMLPLRGIVSISEGANDAMALDRSGAVYQWGDNFFGQLNANHDTTDRATPVRVTGLPPALAIAQGYDHAYIVTRQHTVWAWGTDFAGELHINGGMEAPDPAPPSPVLGVTGVRALSAGKFVVALARSASNGGANPTT